MKLAIALRIYPGVSKQPFVYHDDKLKIVKLMLYSLRSSLEGVEYKVWCILDNCDTKYSKTVLEILDSERVVIVNYKGEGNFFTFKSQIEILLNQDFSDIIMFAEDDYIYLPKTLGKIVQLLKSHNEISYVSPYDNVDYYKMKFHKYRKQILLIDNVHYMQVSTTCLTFFTRKEILRENMNTFLKYSKKHQDSMLWLAITRMNLLEFVLFNKKQNVK